MESRHMRHVVAVICATAIAFSSSPAAARTEYRLGGADGNPWEAATNPAGAGEYVILDTGGNVERTVAVGVSPFGRASNTMIVVDRTGTSISPREFDGTVDVAVTDNTTGPGDVPLPLVGGRVQVATSCVHAGTVSLWKPTFDGDPSTSTFNLIRTDVPHGGGYRGAAIVDLTAALPLNHIRFYPRLGQRDDLRLIETLTEPKEAIHDLSDFGIDSFAENLLNGYTIRVADNSVNIFITGPCDSPPRGTHSVHENWVKREDPRFDVLFSTEENLDTVVDLTFPTRSIRYLVLEPEPSQSWEVAELEIFPEGFVRETRIVSQIMDFHKPVNWGKVRWSGVFRENTRVEIRTRTGNTADPNLFFETDPNGNVVPTTRELYEDINFLEQLPIEYDSENWTFWSPVYDFEAGLRDSSQLAKAWSDGVPIVSEGLGRYLQMDIRLFSTFKIAPRVDQIAILFSETPVAQEVVGEIWPIDVPSFEPETFTYVIKPRFEEDDTGFDRLEVVTHARVTDVRSVTLDGSFEVDLQEFPPLIEDNRLTVGFPFRVASPDSSFKQIEVVFDVPVLRFGSQFTGWVYDSGDPDLIKQRIQPGNATFRFSGDDLSVRSPIGGDLLVDVAAAPNPFTPNGDGVNEAVVVSYKLREVTAGRQVKLEIFDLSGRAVATLGDEFNTSGAYTQEWNGRDDAGRLVPPGSYLYRLVLDAETAEEKLGLFAVAY